MTEQVSETAEAMGCELSGGALKLFATDLAPYPDEAIARALTACRREIKGRDGFPPRLTIPAILERIGVINGEDKELAAATLAWEHVLMFASKFVSRRNGEWVVGRFVHPPAKDCQKCAGSGLQELSNPGETRVLAICDCKRIEQVPEVSERIRSVVALMGGWGKFKEIAEASFPFVKREFIEEFRRYKKVEAYRSRIPLGEGTREVPGRITSGNVAGFLVK